MTDAGQAQETNRTTVSGDRNAHFEETLSISPGDINPSKWVVILLAVGIVGLAPAYFGLVWFGGIVIGICALAAYIGFGRRVHVRVTDAGVDINLNWYGLDRSTGVEIPFADIVGVEFTVPDGSHIRVKPGETTGANRYMTPQHDQGDYRDGIRIEQMGDGPVYVGTKRPAELAEVIAERTPRVDRAEPFIVEE